MFSLFYVPCHLTNKTENSFAGVQSPKRHFKPFNGGSSHLAWQKMSFECVEGGATLPKLLMFLTFCRGRRVNLNLGCFLFSCPRGKNGFLLSLKRKTNVNAYYKKKMKHRHIQIS